MDIKDIKTWGDAIQTIVELKEQDKVLKAKIGMAMRDIFTEDRCEACAYVRDYIDTCKCDTCSYGSNWKWRGED